MEQKYIFLTNMKNNNYFNILFLVAILLQLHGAEIKASSFECGEHGKFEYCIDNFPGCVIGCHCHPGFYFDSESKICEPNSKLTVDYQRHNDFQPTRNPYNMLLTPTPSTTKKLQDNTDDADDLSEWLYNQFVRAIENQVINKTTENETTLTRRSTGDHNKKVKRKPKRINSLRNKSKKRRKSDLRRKLLRISENDSIFDSSDSGDDRDDTDSSSRSSSSSGSDDSDDDHDHKRFVAIRKKKTKLPSFIFLPNYETPYYPPIGLPPPPMFPVVPPLMPIYQQKETTTAMATTTAALDKEKESSNDKVKDPQNDKVKDSQNEKGKDPQNEKGKDPQNHKVKDPQNDKVKDPQNKRGKDPQNEKGKDSQNNDVKQTETKKKEGFERRHKNYEADRVKKRNRVLQMLRTKNRLNPNIGESYDQKHLIASSYPSLEETQKVPFDSTEPRIMKPIKKLPIFKTDDDDDEASFVNDANFQYLSQLIHKKEPTNVNKNINPGNQMLPPIETNRRIGYVSQNNRFVTPELTQNIKEPDELYYAKLGKEIATLIQKIDFKPSKLINSEALIEVIPQPHPVFNNNNYKSYWERSVRSPFSNKNTIDRNYIRLRNGDRIDDLFDVESKVQEILTAAPSLTLQQLENLVRSDKRFQMYVPKMQRPEAIPTIDRLNVNLLSEKMLLNDPFQNYRSSVERNSNKRIHDTNFENGNSYNMINSKEKANNIDVKYSIPGNNQNKFSTWIKDKISKSNGINKFRQPSIEERGPYNKTTDQLKTAPVYLGNVYHTHKDNDMNINSSRSSKIQYPHVMYKPNLPTYKKPSVFNNDIEQFDLIDFF